MSAVTGIVAGVVTAAGAVALYRFVERRTRPLRDAIEEARFRAKPTKAQVIDFERDPATGVFRQR